MAGISLGRALADNSTAKIIILEARDRSGGRLYSIDTPYGRLDTGAMWIHDGLPGQALYDLAVDLGVELSPPEDYFSAATFTADGHPSSVGSLDPAVYAAWITDMLGSIEEARAVEADAAATKSSVEDESINDVYQRFVVKNNITQKGLLPTTNLMAHTAYQTLLNGNLTALSALRYGDAKVLPAVDVLLKRGFDHLTDLLKVGLDIRYSTPVVGVAQTADGVAVAAADGTVYRAKYAVSTLPLGVMKEKAVTFDPPLPPAKAAAVDAMGFGVFDKVILVWDPDQMFWNATDFISREMPDLAGTWAIFLNQNRTLGVPSLVAVNVADTARALEERPDDEVVADVLGVLRSMYGADAVPPPLQTHVTHWAADPWARGAYSYFAVGNPRNITAMLAEPHDRVLFAGEATSEYPATVLGAHLSGRREAERLAGLLAGDV